MRTALLMHCKSYTPVREWKLVNKVLRASSYERSWPGWSGYRDLASLLFPLLKFWCFHMRVWANSVAEISATGMKIISYEYSSQVNRDATCLTKITSLSKHSNPNGIILVSISASEGCVLALITIVVKSKETARLNGCKPHNVYMTTLVLFLNFKPAWNFPSKQTTEATRL